MEARASALFESADINSDGLLTRTEIRQHVSRSEQWAELLCESPGSRWKPLWESIASEQGHVDDAKQFSKDEFIAVYSATFRQFAFEQVQQWASKCLGDPTVLRAHLEHLLVAFQSKFLGGAGQRLEALTTGGGTRSINLAFESILIKGQPLLDAYPPGTKLKILTGLAAPSRFSAFK